MNSFISKFPKILCGVSLLSAISISSLSSCKSQDNVQEMELYCDKDTLIPGDQATVKGILLPVLKRSQDFIWSLSIEYEGLSISDDGVIAVSSSIKLSSPIIVSVLAIYKENHDINSSLDFTIMRSPTYDFQGFYNNEISYYDRRHNLQTMQFIQKPGTLEYSLPNPIDVYYQDILPEGATSWFSFIPLIPSDLRYMRFQLKGGASAQHGLMWDPSYTDGFWTLDIPSFDVFDIYPLKDTIYVSFACDPRIKVTLDFNLWASTDNLSNGRFNYYSSSPDDIHTIEYQEDGIYRCNLFCPAKRNVGIYQGFLDTIYCFRPKFQYTDFIFKVKINPSLDSEIKAMFHLSPEIGTTFILPVIQRDFDNFRYYAFSANYEFDLSKRTHDASYFGYKNIYLASIDAYDTLTGQEEMLACRLDFYIDWIWEG